MDVTAVAENFVSFLSDCSSASSNGESNLRAYSYEVDLGGGRSEEVSLTLLPPLVHSPLSEITGPLSCPTVVIASTHTIVKEDEGEEENDSPELKPILGQFSTFSPTECRSEFPPEEEGKKRLDTVELVSKEIIHVGSKSVTSTQKPDDTVAVSLHANLNKLACISLDFARTMTSLYLIGAQAKGSTGLPALWVPCTHTEGIVKENIVGIGCAPIATSAEDLKVKVYSVREKTPMSGVGREKGAGVKLGKAELKGDAYAKYAVMTTEANNTTEEGGEISLEFSWENPDSFLAQPPTFGTEAVLNVSAEPGTLPAVLSSFSELQALLRICEAASEGRERWGDLESEESADEDPVFQQKDDDSLVSKVGEFMKKVSSPFSSPHDLAVLSPTLENTLFKKRSILDFSENLWLFLKDARSPYDFQATLVALFKELMFGKKNNVILRESSKSPMAMLLRKLLKCKSEMEHKELAPKVHLFLSPARSIPSLAMMGIEKLRQDFKVFLTSAGVASEEDIASFLRVSVDNEDKEEDVLQQCHSLCNLYQVIELVGTAMSLQCLPPSSLTLLTRSAMDYYRHRLPFVSFEMTPLFSIALPRVSTVLRPIVEMCVESTASLNTWKLCSKTVGKIFIMKSDGFGREQKQGHTYEISYTEV